MYRELFEISWTADDRGPTHDATINLGTTLVGELYRKDDKEPDLVHNKIFVALRGNRSTDARALAKYTKLADSCKLQSMYGTGEQPTLQSKEIIKFTMHLCRQTNGPFENTTLKLLDSYTTCARKHGDTDDLLVTYEDFWNKRGSQIAWHDRNISRIGQSLAAKKRQWI